MRPTFSGEAEEVRGASSERFMPFLTAADNEKESERRVNNRAITMNRRKDYSTSPRIIWENVLLTTLREMGANLSGIYVFSALDFTLDKRSFYMSRACASLAHASLCSLCMCISFISLFLFLIAINCPSWVITYR